VGIDPYDFAETTSRLPHKLLSKFSFLNKISPVNFRKALGISPKSNTKANGLWLWAMIKRDQPTADFQPDIKYLLQWIEENKATEYTQFSMGFSFKMALSRYTSGPGKTSLIISLFVVFPLIELYKKTNDPAILEKILSFESLLENEWMRFESDNELWYSYLPKQKDEVYNATAKIGRFYAALYAVHPQPRYVTIITKIQNYLCRVQEQDGRWGYSVKAPYVDNFHTVFMLESMLEMRHVTDTPQYREAFDKGMRYYREMCFEGGKPLHFSRQHGTNDIRTKILGTEIRDCANAIILFAKTGDKAMADSVLQWTFNNLYDKKKNYFYFYKNKVYTNKLNFVRWQSWMALALAEYLTLDNEKN
jgi:hypothetical protein